MNKTIIWATQNKFAANLNSELGRVARFCDSPSQKSSGCSPQRFDTQLIPQYDERITWVTRNTKCGEFNWHGIKADTNYRKRRGYILDWLNKLPNFLNSADFTVTFGKIINKADPHVENFCLRLFSQAYLFRTISLFFLGDGLPSSTGPILLQVKYQKITSCWFGRRAEWSGPRCPLRQAECAAIRIPLFKIPTPF